MIKLFRSFFAAVAVYAVSASGASAMLESPFVENKDYLFPLTYQEAEEAISRALADKGAGEKIAATMNGRNLNKPLFSYSKPMRVELRGLRFDEAAQHWSGNLLVIAEEEVVTAMPAAGRYDQMVEVPVLKRPVKNGSLIGISDIEIRDIPMTQTRTDTVTDIASLIGKSPVHSISASRPIREHEIEPPPLVKKNSIVQMRYTSPGMEITTTGQALDDGGKGNVIGVRNLSSKRVVQAVVEDVSAVTVLAPNASRAALTTSSPGAGIHATN